MLLGIPHHPGTEAMTCGVLVGSGVKESLGGPSMVLAGSRVKESPGGPGLRTLIWVYLVCLVVLEWTLEDS